MADQKALELFLSDPERYVPPLAPNKLPAPELLPMRHVPAEVKASQEIELLGYCPVTFLDGHCRYEQCLVKIYNNDRFFKIVLSFTCQLGVNFYSLQS